MHLGTLMQCHSAWYLSTFQLSSASGTGTLTNKARQVEVGEGLLGKTFQNQILPLPHSSPHPHAFFQGFHSKFKHAPEKRSNEISGSRGELCLLQHLFLLAQGLYMDVRKRNQKKHLKNDHEILEKIIFCSCQFSPPSAPVLLEIFSPIFD